MHAGDVFHATGTPLLDMNNGGSGVAYPETLAKVGQRHQGRRHRDPGPQRVTDWAALMEFSEFNREFLAATQAAKTAGKTADQAAAEPSSREVQRVSDGRPEGQRREDLRGARQEVATSNRSRSNRSEVIERARASPVQIDALHASGEFVPIDGLPRRAPPLPQTRIQRQCPPTPASRPRAAWRCRWRRRAQAFQPRAGRR